MTTPTVDIIVPVWNNPFETRACLSALLKYSPDARLIIVSNGSSRTTELMLEEFSEALEDNGIFIICDSNLGLVSALNRGLSCSDRDYAAVIRPTTVVSSGWLEHLLTVAELTQAGIVSPVFNGDGKPRLSPLAKGCSLMETCSISFSALLLLGKMRLEIGLFDEKLDGGDWCLTDYLRKAEQAGYRTCVTMKSDLHCLVDNSVEYGSAQRKQQKRDESQEICQKRWGTPKNFSIYPGKEATTVDIELLFQKALQYARRGNSLNFLLHWKQHKECRKRGWHSLHTNITLTRLPLFGAVETAKKEAANSPEI